MKEFVCIVCPASCRLTVEEHNGVIRVTGNTCPRGEEYARQEYAEPKRLLTTTVLTDGRLHRRLPVVSNGEIPKAMLRTCLGELYALRVTLPVACGDVLVQDICGSGVDIIASDTIESEEN